MITIKKALAEQKQEIFSLLEKSTLTTEDITEKTLEHFFVATNDQGDLLGVAGVECHGDYGLFRSLAVDSVHQHQGLGERLITAIEAHAFSEGVQELYLLTITAPDYFPKFGYQNCDRNLVPKAISNTMEFSSLCPAAATCLKKTI